MRRCTYYFIGILFLFFLSADDGLSCFCNVGFSQGCLEHQFCSILSPSAHCIIEVTWPDMEVVFQGCSDLLPAFFNCDSKVHETGSDRLFLCCLTDNCNSIEAVMVQVNPTGAMTTHIALTTPGSFPTRTSPSPSSVLAKSPNGKLKATFTKHIYTYTYTAVLQFLY